MTHALLECISSLLHFSDFFGRKSGKTCCCQQSYAACVHAFEAALPCTVATIYHPHLDICRIQSISLLFCQRTPLPHAHSLSRYEGLCSLCRRRRRRRPAPSYTMSTTPRCTLSRTLRTNLRCPILQLLSPLILVSCLPLPPALPRLLVRCTRQHRPVVCCGGRRRALQGDV